MLSLLLSPKTKEAGPVIEVVSSSSAQVADLEEEFKDLRISNSGYGYQNRHSGVFKGREGELYEIADQNPEELDSSDRAKKLYCKVQHEFNFEAFLVEQAFNPETECLLEAKYPALESEDLKEALEKQEIDCLIRLKRHQILLDSSMARGTWLQLVDILFGYLYNFRITSFTNECSESCWNIRKLSRTLSGFVLPRQCVEEVVAQCAIRAFTYPLYRGVQLIKKIALEDLPRLIMKHSRISILKALLSIKWQFQGKEPHFLHNRLYIDDLIIWIQKIEEARLSQYLEEFRNFEQKKFLDRIKQFCQENQATEN